MKKVPLKFLQLRTTDPFFHCRTSLLASAFEALQSLLAYFYDLNPLFTVLSNTLPLSKSLESFYASPLETADMSSTIVHPTSFVTSVVRATSTQTSAAQQTATTIPQAPTAAGTWAADESNRDGWSPAAIIGIVAAVVLILISVPLVAILLRRYERKRLRETVNNSGSSGLGSSKSSVKEGQSLRSILVTRELQRTSLKLAEGVDKPEPAHLHEKGWNRTEVRGGDWK